MISKQLLRKLLSIQSYSSITFIYKNASATATLILSYYLKIGITSSWIKNKWESLWTTLKKSQSNISFKL